MSVDCQDYEKIVEICRIDNPAGKGYAELLRMCKQKFPIESWKIFENVNIEEDQVQLNSWFFNLLVTEPPPKDLKAVWFGLFQRKEKDLCLWTLYVGGTQVDSEKDSEWMTQIMRGWWPTQRYFNSTALMNISEKLQNLGPEAMQYADYVLILGYAGIIVSYIIRSTNFQEWSKEMNDPIRVSIGFDNGDFLRVK